MRKLVTLGTLVLAASLAACSGGGSTSIPGSPAAPVPTVAPTSAPVTPAGVSRFAVTLPIRKGTSSNTRSAKYVSPNTGTLLIAATEVNGVPITPAITFRLDLGGSNCTDNGNGTKTCTLTGAVPSGNINFHFLGYYVANSNNVPLEQGNVIAAIAPGSTPSPVDVTLKGFPQTITLGFAASQTDPQHYPLTFAVTDASGASIVGGFVAPIMLQDSEGPNGNTKLSVNGGTPAYRVSVANNTDSVVLVNSQGASNPTISVLADSYNADNYWGFSFASINTSGNTVSFTCSSAGCSPPGVAGFTIH